MLKYAAAAEIAETACDSYEWNGQTYTVSGDYDQTFTAANGCDSVVTLHLTINSSYAVSDTKTVCESELPYDWNGVVFNAAGTQEVTLTAANGCDSVVTMTLMLKYAAAAEIAETACDSYEWNGQTYTVSGDYDQTFTAANGCDSVVTLHLTINSSYAVTDTKTVCESELPYEWNGVTFDAAGTQEVTLTAANGCDSVVTMTLMLKYAAAAEIAETACDSYEWNGQTYTVSGDYDQTFTAANGCDSVVTLHLTINTSYAVTDTKTVCASELPYTWNDVVFNAAGTQNVTLQAANGCDSVVTMTLMLKFAAAAEIAETACDSYEWNGQTFTVSGDYDQTFTAANGCDSVVTLHLTINSSYAVTDTKTVCASELPYTWNGVVFNAAGTQNVTLQAANGCDSVMTMTLTVNPTYTVTDTRSVCPSELPYTWNGVVFNNASAQSVTLQATNGCDSVVTMILTVNQTHVTTDSRTICQSELPYTWNGVVFNAASVKTATLQDANGCDSTVIMTLTVNPTYNITETQSVCQSELPYTWHGITFNAAGTQVLNLQTVSGCDSVVTLTLAVNPTYAVTDTRSVCPSELPYTWNGVVFNAAGAQSVILQAANGCDSTVTMILTVNQTHVTTDSRTVCQSELPYSWNGITFSSAGVMTATLQDANGCDSTVIMTLTVNPTYNITETQSVCQSDLPYVWNGITFDAAGTQVLNLQTVSGCDSVITMTLTVNSAVQSDLYETVCDNHEWNGITYTESGDYTQTFPAANGCDSVVILHLTVNQSVSTETTVSCPDSCYIWNGQSYCASGDYTQTLQTVNGCDSTVTLHLTITVGINEHSLASSMTVYPNPTSGIVNVQCTMTDMQTETVEFHVHDAYGKLVDVVETRFIASGEPATAQIDLSRYANGVYFVKAVANGNVVAVRKVVKR
jgi:hypothetical protein